MAGLSRCTAHNFQVAYRSFRAYLVTQVPDDGAPLGATLHDIDGWIAVLRTRPRPAAANSIHRYWRSVRGFFGYVEHLTGLPSPFAGLRPPRLPDRIPKARTPAECARILAAVANYPGWSAFERGRNRALIGMALYAGLRRGDLVRLQYANVDVQERTIRVEGGKGRGGGKDRVVMMAPDLLDIVLAYLRERHRRRLVLPEFFASTAGQRPIADVTINRLVRRLRIASGVPFTLHSLRHSFVTQLLRAGVPLHTVSALAGHTQITTTAGYLRVWDEDKVAAVQRLSFDG